MLQHYPSVCIISVIQHYGHREQLHHHSYIYTIIMCHPTSTPSYSIHTASPYIISITQHYSHHRAFMLQYDASPYIISIIQHYSHHRAFMVQHDHPTSSPSCYIMATVSIHAATLSIILHHLHHPTLWQA